MAEVAPFVHEVAAARAAQPAWCDRPLQERLRVVREARYLLVERQSRFTAAVEADIRRPPRDVVATDLLPTAAAAKWLVQNAKRVLRPERAGGRPVWLTGCRDTVHRRARGVVGLIGTWNYPLFLNAVPILHALTAGNAVVWKPSEFVPTFASELADWLAASGCPENLVVTLPATRDGGERLAESDVDFVHFTGSDRVGSRLARRLGGRLIPSTLELSGCDALIVLDDADLPLAAQSAWYAATLNAGQTCLAARRVFVPRSLEAAFLAELEPFLAEPRFAAQPLASAPQAAHAEELIAEAVAGGHAVRRGAADSSAFAPAVILGATPSLRACREALFAPVASVLTYDTEAELLALESACPFALGAAVFTRDPERGHALAARLRAGSVILNDVVVPTAHPGTAFGGRGKSGWGVTQGPGGLLDMTLPQVVTERAGNFRPHLASYFRPTKQSERAVEVIFRASHGRTLWRRAQALWQRPR